MAMSSWSENSGSLWRIARNAKKSVMSRIMNTKIGCTRSKKSTTSNPRSSGANSLIRQRGTTMTNQPKEEEKPETLEFKANMTGTDANGKAYSDY